MKGVTMLQQLERLLKIRTAQSVTNRIVYIDDVEKKVLKKTIFQAIDGNSISFGEIEDFPYSHHTN